MRKINFNSRNKSTVNITGTAIEMYFERYTTEGVIQCPCYADYMIFVADSATPTTVVALMPGDFQKYPKGTQVFVYTQNPYIDTLSAPVDTRHFLDGLFVSKVESEHKLVVQNAPVNYDTAAFAAVAVNTTLATRQLSDFRMISYHAQLTIGANSFLILAIVPTRNFIANQGMGVLDLAGAQLIAMWSTAGQKIDVNDARPIVVPPGYTLVVELSAGAASTGQYWIGAKTY